MTGLGQHGNLRFQCSLLYRALERDALDAYWQAHTGLLQPPPELDHLVKMA